MANNFPDENASAMHHFLIQLDSIVQKLDMTAQKAIENKIEATQDADWAKELYRIAKAEPGYIRCGNVYQLLLNNWEISKNWSITYRLLSDMVSMQKKWQNSEDTRYKLVQILKNVSNEWI